MPEVSDFFVRFWGVRGSIPCPGDDVVHYGGNTSCLEIRCGPHVLILDGGTGLRPFDLSRAGDGALDAGDIGGEGRNERDAVRHLTCGDMRAARGFKGTALNKARGEERKAHLRFPVGCGAAPSNAAYPGNSKDRAKRS